MILLHCALTRGPRIVLLLHFVVFVFVFVFVVDFNKEKKKNKKETKEREKERCDEENNNNSNNSNDKCAARESSDLKVCSDKGITHIYIYGCYVQGIRGLGRVKRNRSLSSSDNTNDRAK